LAAQNGHEGCLRVLHELGAGASLSAQDAEKYTPAHWAAQNGHEGCLRVLHELGAGASLSAEDAEKYTPAHCAAENGHEGCLRALHECLSLMIDPLLKGLSQFRSATTITNAQIHELEAMRALAVAAHSDNMDSSPADDDGSTPAHDAAAAGHTSCVRFLSEIGGTAALLQDVQADPELLEDTYSCLLLEPRLLDLPTKQAWLSWSLQKTVGGAGAEQLELVCRRDNMLLGLCGMLGVNEATGELLSGDDAPQPSAIGVRFEGENGTGDGLRREWFDGIVSEMLDLTRGLFISKDGGRSLVPNPHSATTAGADHLSYFALLGRIAGLALFHREPLNASWSRSFIKAVFEFELTAADLESVDPEAYEKKVVYIRDGVYSSRDQIVLEDLALTFTDDNDAKLLYDSLAERNACVELKAGGAEMSVTEENKVEYIQLLVEHRVVGAIRPQITAFRNGLGVFVTAALQAKLRQCTTAADMQLLMCGVQEIDVDDWQASADYSGGFDASSRTVLWFWAAVRRMTNEERSKLLLFCTGSARAPATGFAHLMGYSGRQQRFRLQRVEGSSERLPTASTCFNTIRLPGSYTDEAQLLGRLQRAMRESEGFDEGAVAE
jgi:E3 ubiquitin-protein ligase HACE1